MEQSLHLSSKSRIRRDNNKNKEEQNVKIVKAYFLGGYKILLNFSDGRQRIINFLPIFKKYVKGYYSKYFLSENFKRFIVENGNIYWGENEEVIFTVSFLLNSRYGITQKEEVLYVI